MPAHEALRLIVEKDDVHAVIVEPRQHGGRDRKLRADVDHQALFAGFIEVVKVDLADLGRVDKDRGIALAHDLGVDRLDRKRTPERVLVFGVDVDLDVHRNLL